MPSVTVDPDTGASGRNRRRGADDEGAQARTSGCSSSFAAAAMAAVGLGRPGDPARFASAVASVPWRASERLLQSPTPGHCAVAAAVVSASQPSAGGRRPAVDHPARAPGRVAQRHDGEREVVGDATCAAVRIVRLSLPQESVESSEPKAHLAGRRAEVLAEAAAAVTWPSVLLHRGHSPRAVQELRVELPIHGRSLVAIRPSGWRIVVDRRVGCGQRRERPVASALPGAAKAALGLRAGPRFDGVAPRLMAPEHGRPSHGRRRPASRAPSARTDPQTVVAHPRLGSTRRDARSPAPREAVSGGVLQTRPAQRRLRASRRGRCTTPRGRADVAVSWWYIRAKAEMVSRPDVSQRGRIRSSLA
jgi:hypothetical protein